MTLSQNEKREILEFVREVIQMELAEAETPPLPDLECLHKTGACFVMLRDFGGGLRGCIGSTEAFESLGENLCRNAINAAFMDPGFPPLEYEELDEVFFEISVLSPPQEIAFPAEFLLGRDGLMLKAGERKAVFLPHIPVEQRWDAFQTAEYLARKAGFSDGSWQGKDVKFYTFQAETFGNRTM